MAGSDASPTQAVPPLAGAGLSQVLVLVPGPEPQVTEHEDGELQADHAPFTKNYHEAELNHALEYFCCAFLPGNGQVTVPQVAES